MGRQIEQDSTYFDRLIRLIPSEIIAAHLAIQDLVISQLDIRDQAIEISAVALFLLLPIYLWRVLGVRSWSQIGLTMGSFIVWVLAVSLPVYQGLGLHPTWGSVILILWTTAIPALAVPNDE